MDTSYTIVLEDQTVLSSLCGANDENLHVFETYLGVPVICRGNEVTVVTSDQTICKRFQKLIDTLLESPEITSDGSADFIASCVANSAPQQETFCPQCIHIPRGIKSVYPKNRKQAALIDSIYANDITFGLGPAGTGKTYIAVALALKMLLSHTVRKLILTRPVVEAGESLGFLPGDLVQKINPYLRPLFDIMETLLPADVLNKRKQGFAIPLASWFRTDLKPMLLDTIGSRAFRERGLFSMQGIQTLVDEHQQGLQDRGELLWMVMVLETWLKTLPEQRPRPPVT